jgi:peptidoglycan/LPS O-acetylase OafA/YrhL
MDGMKPGAVADSAADPLLGKGRQSEHIPALDGLRGLAIVMVMVCHFTIIEKGLLIDRMYGAAGRFGWVGVDLFFVLSGFLITGILIGSKDQPHYFRNFYARRILRIFPLYYAVIAFVFFVLPLLPLASNPRFQTISWKESLLYWF